MRTVGTVIRGIRAPIIKQGDDLVAIAAESVVRASQEENFSFNDRDIIAVTESIVARASGNYASINDIADDVSAKFDSDTIGVIFPILSRNRFAVCLRGIAKKMKKIYLMLSYPSDEVGNHLFDEDLLDDKEINPWSTVLTEAEYRREFGYPTHPFTGIDYVEYYSSLIREFGCEAEVIFSNNAVSVLDYTKHILTCDIHTRSRTKRRLLAAGAKQVFALDEIMASPSADSGYNEQYGLLGSNKATEDTVKLFPREPQKFVDELYARIKEMTGRNIEVMIYGDGAFKDPAGKIWELADPVVSPAYTPGLAGTPNELKIKYLADNDFSELSGEALTEAIKSSINAKSSDLKGSMASEGTTPRRLTDLIGSLCDLTSGSGDKGTPIVLIQGYFDNYSQDV